MKNQQSQTLSTEYEEFITNFIGEEPIYLKTWSLYAWRRGKHSQNQEYSKNVIPIATITSLEEFFCYYHALKLPSEYQIDTKVMFFLDGCRPMWEDWQNSGALLLQFKDKSEGNQNQAMDDIWEYLIFSLVGNQLDPEIIGVCLNKHQKQTLIEIWLRSSNRKVEVMQSIERTMQRDIDHLKKKLKREIKFKYKDHTASIQSQSTMKGVQNLTISPPIKSNHPL